MLRMRTGSDRRAAAEGGATFSLETFGWGAPDRLVVSGTFSGLPAEPLAPAVLTVLGADGPHHLMAVDDDADAPVDGASWTAAFAWLEAPVAFERARLVLGDRLAVDLPAPGGGIARADGLPLEPLHAGDAADQPAADGSPEPADVGSAVDRLRLETQLLEETEQLEEARASARRAAEALQRAEADLAEERSLRAADADRFREGLATVRGSAEEAIAAAAAASDRAEQQAHALRTRVAELEAASTEVDAVRSELAEAREELEQTRGDVRSLRDELDAARGALAGARAGAQELLDQLADPTIAGR